MKNVIEMPLLTILFSMLVFDAVLLNVDAETSTTTVSVVPTSQVIGEKYKLLPENFTINLTVTNVTDLVAWQTVVYYSSRILNLTDVTNAYATGHVFEGKSICAVEPIIKTWTKTLENETTVDFSNSIGTEWLGVTEGPVPPYVWRHYNITQWLDLDESGTLTTLDIIFVEPNYPTVIEYYYVDRIITNITTVELDISMTYIQYGANLAHGQATFSGNGILCQMTFDAIRPGNSFLNFSVAETLLLDSDIHEMSRGLAGGNVEVFGVPTANSNLVTDYNKLQSSYDQLNSSYTQLQDSYDRLQSEKEATINELNTTRNLMYIFIATTIIFMVATGFFLYYHR